MTTCPAKTQVELKRGDAAERATGPAEGLYPWVFCSEVSNALRGLFVGGSVETDPVERKLAAAASAAGGAGWGGDGVGPAVQPDPTRDKSAADRVKAIEKTSKEIRAQVLQRIWEVFERFGVVPSDLDVVEAVLDDKQFQAWSKVAESGKKSSSAKGGGAAPEDDDEEPDEDVFV